MIGMGTASLVRTTHINGAKNTAVGHIVTHTHPGAPLSIRSPRPPPVAPRQTSRRGARAAKDYPRPCNHHTLARVLTQQPFRCRNDLVAISLSRKWVAFVCGRSVFVFGYLLRRGQLQTTEIAQGVVFTPPLLNRALPDASVGCPNLLCVSCSVWRHPNIILSPSVTIKSFRVRDGFTQTCPRRPLFSAGVGVSFVSCLAVFGWRSRRRSGGSLAGVVLQVWLKFERSFEVPSID